MTKLNWDKVRADRNACGRGAEMLTNEDKTLTPTGHPASDPNAQSVSSYVHRDAKRAAWNIQHATFNRAALNKGAGKITHVRGPSAGKTGPITIVSVPESIDDARKAIIEGEREKARIRGKRWAKRHR